MTNNQKFINNENTKPNGYLITDINEIKSKPGMIKLSEFLKTNTNLKKNNTNINTGIAAKKNNFNHTLTSVKDQVKTLYYKDFISKIGI